MSIQERKKKKSLNEEACPFDDVFLLGKGHLLSLSDKVTSGIYFSPFRFFNNYLEK